MSRNAGTIWPRRRFLMGALAGVASATLPRGARGLWRSPNETIGAGIIGLGDRGRSHLATLLKFPGLRVVALCDVQRDALDRARAQVAREYGTAADHACQAVTDYRRMLENPAVDVVVICSPENWHAKMAVDALRAGRDVYCEKALALTVEEGRAICNEVRRAGRVLQTGTQQRSDWKFRLACDLVRAGFLGRVRTVWVSVPGGRALGVLPPAPVPPGLDYELWLGPARYRPYREGLCTFNWYFVRDYCAGWIQSWGVHHVDIALWGLPEFATAPLTIQGTATFPEEGDGDTSISWQVTVESASGVRMVFTSDDRAVHGHGVRFEGDRGWVHVTRAAIRAEPMELLHVKFGPDHHGLPVSRDHMANFLDCVRTRREPIAPAEGCQRATALTLAADLATRLGRPLTWDPVQERFGDPMANRFLRRSYRSPWTL